MNGPVFINLFRSGFKATSKKVFIRTRTCNLRSLSIRLAPDLSEYWLLVKDMVKRETYTICGVAVALFYRKHWARGF